MKNGFQLTGFIPAPAADVYQAWLSTEGHTSMTGSPAQVDGKVGGPFTAWDGYISGSTIELTPNRQIVQAWRTAEFPEEAPNSRLEILFEETKGGTTLTLLHTDLPEEQVNSYRQGWEDFYFRPMKEYFGRK